MMTDERPIAIVGAGLAGSLLAALLAKQGRRVLIVERRKDLRKTVVAAGRSINLALSTRGITALQLAGVDDLVLPLCVEMPGRLMHAPSGVLTYQPYGSAGQSIRSVSRRDLNALLLDAAEAAGASLRFETSCEDLDPDSGLLTLRDAASGNQEEIACDFVVGADGANSAVRIALRRRGHLTDVETTLEHGYKELNITPDRDGSFRLERAALHIWPRGDFMLIALPNPGGDFTLTLFLEVAGERGFDAIAEPAAARAFFEEHFADALALMPDFDEQWAARPVSRLAYLHTSTFHAGARALLVGDAAHAVVPFYGQGMNASFEDCTILMQLLEAHAGTFSADLCRDYTAARKPNGDAICALALGNFIEMRDKVASPSFLFRRRIEAALHALEPERFIPLYTMVTFSNRPYAESQERARRQDGWLDAALALIGCSLDETDQDPAAIAPRLLDALPLPH
jgi:kynurenine 3-monooxygenase